MSKYNTKKEKRTPSTVNKMGEAAYQLSPKEELVTTVLTTFVQKSYYETELEVVNRIKKAMATCDPLFIAKLALYTRREANMRSSSHLLAGELAKRASGKEWAKRFYEKIIVRPDDMSEILAYLQANKQKTPNAIRKGFKKVLERLDPYQIDKYKMKTRSISLIDLVNLFHPIPAQHNAEAYRRLLVGEPLDDLYESKILEKTSSAAGKSKEKQKEAIEEVLGNVKGMPIFNLVRNLRNIIQKAPDQIEEAVRQLTIPNKIIKSRLLPFRFATAYEEIVKLRPSVSKTVSFEKDTNAGVEEVLVALEKAIEIACHNIPKLEGNTAILVDHSGSVRGDSGGSSLVSKFSKVTTAQIGNLFANMLASTQDNIYFGMFGDRLVPYKYDRSKGLLENHNNSYLDGARCGGNTENGIYKFLKAVIDENKKVDNLVVFSDMVIGSRSPVFDVTSTVTYGGFQKLFKDFRKVNPHCNVVSINIKQTDGTTVFDYSLGVTQVAGWSDKIFDIVDKGSTGYKRLVEEIEKIEI